MYLDWIKTQEHNKTDSYSVHVTRTLVKFYSRLLSRVIDQLCITIFGLINANVKYCI